MQSCRHSSSYAAVALLKTSARFKNA